MQTRQLWYIVVALLLIVIGLFGKQFLDQQSDASFTEIRAASAECDLQVDRCSIEFSDGTNITLQITPKPISALVPLTFTVSTSNDEITDLVIQVTGTNMDMGNTRFPIPKTATQQFKGEGILPICTQSTMLWRIRAIVTDSQNQHFGADFPLKTTNSVKQP